MLKTARSSPTDSRCCGVHTMLAQPSTTRSFNKATTHEATARLAPSKTIRRPLHCFCHKESSFQVLQRFHRSRPSVSLRSSMVARAQATSQGALGQTGSSKTSVLFVCLGNICRSPTAEAMFRSVVEKAGVADQFDIDSCGTGGGSSNWYLPGGFSYHEGDASDPRMTAAAIKRGVRLTSTSRPLRPEDLNRFDYIIGMDPRNARDILKAASYWAENDKQLPGLEEVRAKTSLMTKYCTKHKAADEVPDPYYGGPAGFEKVLDLLDDAATGLLQHVQAEQKVKA